ncbi:hypothetical protein [Methylobacter sp.]|uniref:hypothetical protein n=1 Tax=Methylobacter sp. TaxID=2051955 RepID=UPI002FDEB459
MRQLVTTALGTLLLSAIAVTVNAQQSTKAGVPEKVKADILKRHPTAQDLQASHEVHFGQDLLEVAFKEEGKEPKLELFKTNGNLFTDELLLEDLNEAPPAVKEVLEKSFPGYELKKAELIANPNGAGEEYEMYLVVGDVNWKVSINEKGNIEGKDSY